MKITCKECRELKEYYAKGICEKCYMEKWRKENPEKARAIKRKWYLANLEKEKARMKKWQLTNPEKVRVAHRKHYLANSEKEKARSKKYFLANSEKVRIANRKRYKDNPEKIRARSRKRYKDNPEKARARSRKRRLDNPEKVAECNKKYYQTFKGRLTMKRSSMKRRAHGIIEKGAISKLITENVLKYGSIGCEKCKEKCPDNYHIDHIMPISKGGNNDYNNLQILCAYCNLSKQVDIADYRNKIENNQLFLK